MLALRFRLPVFGRGPFWSSAPVTQEAKDARTPPQRFGVRSPRTGARGIDEREVLRIKLVSEGGGATPVSVPALLRHRIATVPSLPLPPVTEDDEFVGVSVRALKDLVQILLVARDDQQRARHTHGSRATPFRQHHHSGAR